MAHTHTWTSTEDNLPNGSSLLGEVDDHIVATRQMVRERLSSEHLFSLTDSNQQGLHRLGSARAFIGASQPTSPFPDPAGTEVSGTEDEGRLWIDETHGFVNVFATSAWNNLSTVAGTAYKLMVRDSAGRSQVAEPSAAADVATKGYVDTAVAALPDDPVGSIKMFAGTVLPAGYLWCRGTSELRATYAELFAVIGTTWGSVDGTHFTLPDLVGAAPVGVGTSTGYTANETFDLGTKYNDQSQGHRHTVSSPNGTTFGGGVLVVAEEAHDVASSDPIDDGTNGTPRVGLTTHGKVVGINFIIRYTAEL